MYVDTVQYQRIAVLPLAILEDEGEGYSTDRKGGRGVQGGEKRGIAGRMIEYMMGEEMKQGDNSRSRRRGGATTEMCSSQGGAGGSAAADQNSRLEVQEALLPYVVSQLARLILRRARTP